MLGEFNFFRKKFHICLINVLFKIKCNAGVSADNFFLFMLVLFNSMSQPPTY